MAAVIFLLISVTIHSQKNHVPDSVNEKQGRALDSVANDTMTLQPEADDFPATRAADSISVYFLNKRTFANDTFNLRHLPDTVISKMKQDADFWYVNAVFNKKKIKRDHDKDSGKLPLRDQTWFQTLLWLIIMGGFAGFIMIYLANSNVFLFRRKPKIIADASEEEMETGDIFTINYPKEIEKAINRSNYRFAVRLMFLRSLKRLSEKNIIQYKQDKTNLDYLLQLNPTSYYRDFFRITRNYEYSWYGKFEIGTEEFSAIKNDFEKFDQRLG